MRSVIVIAARHFRSATSLLALGLVVGAALPQRVGAQNTSIDLRSTQSADPNVTDFPTGPFGTPFTTTYGQTFTVPVGYSFLQNFSFWLVNDDGISTENAASLQFRAYIMAWSTDRASGPVLYSSNLFNGPAAGTQRYTFGAPNIALSSGMTYVAFLSTSEVVGPPNGVAYAAMDTYLDFTGGYLDGGFVFANNGADFSQLTSQAWDGGQAIDGYEARFHASFTATSVVPEPSTVVLLGSAFAVLIVAARRRRMA